MVVLNRETYDLLSLVPLDFKDLGISCHFYDVL